MQTKWDLISDDERARLATIEFGRPCSGCGVTLPTEADFARHFIVPDSRYKNLGECPNRMLDKNERQRFLHQYCKMHDLYDCPYAHGTDPNLVVESIQTLHAAVRELLDS